MKTINKIYVNGEFVTPHGTQTLGLINPAAGRKMEEVILADEVDTKMRLSQLRRH